MKKNLNFTLDKSAIDNWIDDNTQTMFEELILAGETLSLVPVIPGIKEKKTIKFITSAVYPQVGGCGVPTSSGLTTITEKELSVKSFSVNETICPEDFNDTSLQLSMLGGFNESLSFGSQWVALKSKGLQAILENQFWFQASGSTIEPGLFNRADADSDVIDVVFDFTATGTTDAQLIAGYRKIIASIPEVLKQESDLYLFMGKNSLERLAIAFQNTNNVLLQKFANTLTGVDEFYFPGSEYLKIKALNGLGKGNNPSYRVMITTLSNIMWLTDMASESKDIKTWFETWDQQIHLRINYKSGQNYKFGGYIVVSQTA